MSNHNEIFDEEFGRIGVRSSSKARRVLFKVKNNMLEVVVPYGVTYKEDFLLELVAKNRVALRRLLCKVAGRMSDTDLYDGKVISFVEGQIHIVADSRVGKRNIRCSCIDNRLIFAYNPTDDISEPNFAKAFSRYILRRMSDRYGFVLQRLVEDFARRFSLSVNEVRIGKGSRILGHCSRVGVITISAYVLFFPSHLRQYIVCHELAHLTHFNHSEAFHQLCNRYCEGNEKSWSQEVRNFRFPIGL